MSGLWDAGSGFWTSDDDDASRGSEKGGGETEPVVPPKPVYLPVIMATPLADPPSQDAKRPSDLLKNNQFAALEDEEEMTEQTEQQLVDVLSALKRERYGVPVETDVEAAAVPFTVTGSIPPAPPPVVVPPADHEGPCIRKRWVLEDNSPVDDFHEKVPNMAVQYPFELDPFQKRAVLHLENHEHVFVAAHTSAGKTVVAEYAIALAERAGLRAVYTSPIKALSNQKFREFSKKFSSVGIVTGDVAINFDAQCLIMTTEILRTMLFQNDPLVAQLGFVIFDEVHYICDPERGVVWEETIILLPSNVTMALLSATVPNYLDFSDWIGRTKQREIFAICTHYRPTPLKHYLWASDKPIPLVDAAGKFNDESFHQVYAAMRAKQKAQEQKKAASSAAASGSSRGGRGGQHQSTRGRGGKKNTGVVNKQPSKAGEAQKLQGLLWKLHETEMLPVVVFAFSRNDCMYFAKAMTSLDVTRGEEKSKIVVFQKAALEGVAEADKELPQLKFVCDLVRRGVGVHHGGLLPLLKEMVEILFSRGLVKVLFATETFAMGVNMPARSVVFSGLYKFDGSRRRMLLASEYTQMAGRAGRRGLDDFGHCYILCPSDEPPDPQNLTKMILAKATPLQSQFRLTLHSLLQLCTRNQTRSPDQMLSRSFRETSRAQRLPMWKRDLQRGRRRLDGIPEIECIFGDPPIAEYTENALKAREIAQKLHLDMWNTPGGRQEFFPRGRLVLVHSLSVAAAPTYGVVLGVDSSITIEDDPCFFMLFLVGKSMPAKSSEPTCRGLPLIRGNIAVGTGMAAVVCGDVPLSHFSAVVVANVPQEEIPEDLAKTLQGIRSNAGKGKEPMSIADAVPLGVRSMLLTNIALVLSRLLDSSDLRAVHVPKKMQWMQLTHFNTLLKQKELNAALCASKCHLCPLRETHFTIEKKRVDCRTEIEEISQAMKNESMNLWPDMQAKLRLLMLRGFISRKTGRVTLKGRVAVELVTTDELTIAEVIFENLLQDLDPPEIAAAMSCFICPDVPSKSSISDEEFAAMDALPARLKDVLGQIEGLHWQIGKQAVTEGCMISEQEWEKICHSHLAAIAYAWANGESFVSIMKRTTSMQEGNIVRAITRLDEVVRKVKGAAQVLGNTTLQRLMEETSTAIRRDIVFTVSLYLSKK